MNIGVLGTGVVGNTIGAKIAELGHSVMMGSRSSSNEKALAWKEKAGEGALVGTFADAAKHGEILFNATGGMVTLDVLNLAGGENLNGKVLIDISNSLDFSKGMPPTLAVCNTDSVGEQIQRAFPKLKVVKSLNTCNCHIMVNPALISGEHDAFVSGDDVDAKAQVTDILKNWFGWKSVIDLGGIQSARGVEMLMPFWLSMWHANGNANFNYHIAR